MTILQPSIAVSEDFLIKNIQTAFFNKILWLKMSE